MLHTSRKTIVTREDVIEFVRRLPEAMVLAGTSVEYEPQLVSFQNIDADLAAPKTGLCKVVLTFERDYTVNQRNGV